MMISCKSLVKRMACVAVMLAALLFVLAPALSGQLPGADNVDKLIRKLGDKHENARAKAARELGDLKDVRAVEPLIKTLKDRDSYVRGQCAISLGKLKDARAVDSLVLALDDDYTYVKEEAARALGEIKNVRAAGPLMNFLKNDSTYVREEAVKSLIKIGPEAIAPLIKARDEKVLGRVADAYAFFICRGEPGTEALLVDALGKHGTARMACDFACSGNILLKAAAYEWAEKHKEKIRMPLNAGDVIVWGRCGG